MHELLPVILFASSTSITPGPNNLMIMNSGLNFGSKRSMPHFLGICFGFQLMVFIIGLGFGAVFIEYPWIKEVLKYIGSAYMIYLAWLMVRHTVVEQEKDSHKPFSFLQGLTFQWVNPKAWVMAVGIISLFTVSQNYILNAALLSLFFLIFGMPCVGVWLLGGVSMQNFLKEKRKREYFNFVMAILLVLSIALIFWE